MIIRKEQVLKFWGVDIVNTVNKNRILNYIMNCGFKTTKFFFIDNKTTDELKSISTKLNYPVRIIAGNERQSFNKEIQDVSEFLMNALVFLNNFDQILVSTPLGTRISKIFIKEDIDTYANRSRLRQLFFALGTDEFHAYGYMVNGEFHFEEIILPDEITNKYYVS